MKGLNAFLGWLLMLAVLAVPSFLFYNWWAKNKRQTAGETTVKSSVKDVFSAAGQRPAGAGPGMRDSGAAPAPVSSVSTITAGGAEPKPTSAPAAPAAADAAKTAAAPVPAARNPGQQAGSSDSAQKASFYAPKASRNPMLSKGLPDHKRTRIQE
ncbi:MAG TPA: hypothetical protein PKI19_10485, partial [Elusimicrobiales bacterium]|nr:hypothetical protein [Elusimicrobiales bacterium]